MLSSKRHEKRCYKLLVGLRQHYERRGFRLAGQPTYGRTSTVAGASGYSHQIDVKVPLVDDQGKAPIILVECKNWRRKITPEAVLCFFGRVKDIRRVYTGRMFPLMLTSSPLSDDSRLLASYFQIELRRVHESARGFEWVEWNGTTAGLLTLPQAELRPTGELQAVKVERPTGEPPVGTEDQREGDTVSQCDLGRG